MACRVSLAAFALFLFAACTRQPVAPSVEHLAILRFENLSGDVSVDWMGRAFSEVIIAGLEAAPGIYVIPSGRLHALDLTLGRRPVTAPGISAERSRALAAGATRVGYGDYWVRQGRLQVRLVLENVRDGRMSTISAYSPSGDVVAAASELARQISSRAMPYATRNPRTVKAYVDVLESGAASGAEELQQALASDADFGPAYRELAEIKARQQDRDGALALLEQALARGPAIGRAERARIEFETAGLRGDSAGRQQALAALANAVPSDPLNWRELGALAMTRRAYAQSADAYRRSLAIEPDASETWNQLGYALAYNGDLAAATSALRRYQALAPGPNPLDSLGDVNMLAGRLHEAEAYYLESARKSPDFYGGLDFLKAAMARLMTGDTAGADGLASQYFQARAAAHDPLLDYRKAQWSWISGRRNAGYQDMVKLARESESGQLREAAAHAYVQLAIWSLLLDKREAAVEMSRQAAALVTPASAPWVLVASLLAQPPASPAEWTSRAERVAPNPILAPIRNLALANALLLGKEYRAAIPVLQELIDNGNAAADEGVPVMLAWAYLETDRVQDAAPLLRFNPLLPTTGLGPLTSLYFPRIFYLRSVAAQKQGKTDEVRESLRLFQQLSGTSAPAGQRQPGPAERHRH
ncbi:MAG TPA: hypothetical protein VLY04_24225 [Bryobacteraceae bacterium]|nr:hypothetical protein [Bryobacteraceae bacterium]